VGVVAVISLGVSHVAQRRVKSVMGEGTRGNCDGFVRGNVGWWKDICGWRLLVKRIKLRMEAMARAVDDL